MHALDGVGGRFGDENAGAGRAGERDHVDVGVAGDRLPDGRPVSVDEVENALGDAGLVENLRENDGVERRDLAGLQHHRAARRQGRRDLAGDLIERPVPGRDQADDADRLLDDQRAALGALELEILQRLDHLLEMRKADADLAP